MAVLRGYVCVKLGVRFPSKGGLITNLVEGFGIFADDTLQKEPATFVAIVALGLASVALDAIVRHGHHPAPSPRPPAG